MVDTGPLFDFLLWKYSVRFKQEDKFIPKLQCLNTSDLIVSMEWFLEKAKPILTSPGVIAEVHRHAQGHLKGASLGDFWKIAQEILQALGLQEQLCQFSELDEEELTKFYPVDTSLIEITRRENRVLLTSDMKLEGYCRTNRISVLSTGELPAIRIQFP